MEGEVWGRAGRGEELSPGPGSPESPHGPRQILAHLLHFITRKTYLLSIYCGWTLSWVRMGTQQTWSLLVIIWQRIQVGSKPGPHGAPTATIWRVQGATAAQAGPPVLALEAVGGQADFLERVTKQRWDRMQQEGKQNR